MSVVNRSSMRRRAVGVALIAVGVLSAPAVVGTLPIANAHAELESSTPVNGAELTAPPTEVRLVFGEVLIADGVDLAAAAEDGRVVDLPAPDVDGPGVTVAWPQDTPAGAYTVSFRVVSQDGHVVRGRIGFTYAAVRATTTPTTSEPRPPTSAPATTGQPASPSAPSPTGTVTPTNSASTVPAPTTSTTAAPAPVTPTTTPVADTSGSSGGVGTLWVIAAGLVAGAGIGVMVSLRRKKSEP